MWIWKHIEAPCSICKISLQKGVKIISIVDLITGCSLTILWAFVLNSTFQHNADPNWEKIEDAGIIILIILLAFAVLQVLLGLLLLIAQSKKSIPPLYIWVTLSALSIPTNGLIIKVYEILVVYAYAFELKIEEQAQALDKFQAFPYVCIVKTQFYPGPKYGLKRKKEETAGQSLRPFSQERKSSMAFYTSKSFIVTESSNALFTLHHHHNRKRDNIEPY